MNLLRHWYFDDTVKRIHLVHQQTDETKYSLVVVGLSGTGKSRLAKWYQKQFPVVKTPEVPSIPVVYVHLKQPSSPNNLIEQIINALGTSIVARKQTLDKMIHQLKTLLEKCKTELVILDEVQECLPDTDGPKAQSMAKAFVAIIDKCKIPLILLGTPSLKRILKLKYRADKEGVSKEEQLSRRFIATCDLSIFISRTDEWLEVVNFFGSKAGMRMLHEHDASLLDRIYVATGGRIGLIKKLFTFTDFTNKSNEIKVLYDGYQLVDTTGCPNPFNNKQYCARTIKIKAQSIERIYGNYRQIDT